MSIRKILLILAAVMLYGFGIFFCHLARDDANLTYLLLTQPIDAARAEDIFTQEAVLTDSVGFCFWGEQKTQWVSCKDTGGIAEVTQVLLSGNPGLLDASILTWQEGCFLDEATAQKLFGTADCSEQTAWQDDRPYRVFGTVSATQPTMLAVAEASHGAVLNRCVLNVPAETGQQTAQQFLLRWGLTGELIDFYPLWVAVYDFLLIPPLFLILRTFFSGRKRIQSRARRIILLVTTICLLIFLGSKIILLPDMLPSRWSDFSFWGTWWKGQQKNFQLVLVTSMGERYLQMLLDMVKSILSTTAATLLTLWTFRRRIYANTAD